MMSKISAAWAAGFRCPFSKAAARGASKLRHVNFVRRDGDVPLLRRARAGPTRGIEATRDGAARDADRVEHVRGGHVHRDRDRVGEPDRGAATEAGDQRGTVAQAHGQEGVGQVRSIAAAMPPASTVASGSGSGGTAVSRLRPQAEHHRFAGPVGQRVRHRAPGDQGAVADPVGGHAVGHHQPRRQHPPAARASRSRPRTGWPAARRAPGRVPICGSGPAPSPRPGRRWPAPRSGHESRRRCSRRPRRPTRR